MHLHFRPYASNVRHSKNKLSAYVDVSDRQQLEKYRGTGYHVARHLLVTEDEYYAPFKPGRGVPVPQFAAALSSIGVKYPY